MQRQPSSPGLVAPGQGDSGPPTAAEMEILEDVCECNGLSLDQVIRGQCGIKRLEMFMHNFPSMSCIRFFSQLTMLQLAQQTFTKIESLEHLPHLESLWLVENNIERIQGLQACVKLRRLFLWGNQIRRIENLDALAGLEVLWLNDNQIAVIENIAALKNLKELNLAGNRIRSLGHSLDPNPGITKLNLSKNLIGSFREIANLAHMPNLTHLALADPHWGPCPVAQLSNYQTYALYVLPLIQSLDAMDIPPDTQQLAEATFLKKRMYYNMRIKTLRRTCRALMRRAREGLVLKTDPLAKSIDAMHREVRSAQRDMHEARLYGGAVDEGPSSTLGLLNAKVRELTRALEIKEAMMRRSGEELRAVVAEAAGVAMENERRLDLELESGGNVRLEEGSPDDLWYQSCSDLVTSRFQASDYDALATCVPGLRIASVAVTRVVRVHNRHLRGAFERESDAVAARMAKAGALPQGGSGRSPVEYLFYGVDPRMGGGEAELIRIAEEGFRDPSEYAALGLDGAIPLTNATGVADLPRCAEAGRVGEGRGALKGRMLLVKTLTGHCRQHTEQYVVPVPAGAGKGLGPIRKSLFPQYDTVCRVVQGNAKAKVWYALSDTLLLPEYLVEFEYTTANGGTFGPKVTQRDQEYLQSLPREVQPVARGLLPFLSLTYPDATRPEAFTADADARLLAMPPVSKPRQPVTVLNESTIREVLGWTSPTLDDLTFLSLHGNAVARVEFLAPLPALTQLVLSWNHLSRIEGLECLTGLRVLDLSHNRIHRVEGLKGQAGLTNLDLSGNSIWGLEDINLLRKYCPDLTKLDLRGNPVAEAKPYKALAVRRLAMLTMLDGAPVRRQEFEGTGSSALTPTVVKQHAYSYRRTVWESGAPLAATADTATTTTAASANASASNSDWRGAVEEVVIEGKRVRRIHSLDGLTSLQRLSLRDNEITRIENLAGLSRLEELHLGDNCVSDVDGVRDVPQLRKLEVDANLLQSLTGLRPLGNLTHLSVDDNLLTSLQGLASLTSLMELYCSGNRIEAPREVLHLKDLPHLIILDLSDNPMTKSDDYRLFTVYHVRRLKVLDGRPVEPAEQAAARQEYSGRLTVDFLEEQVGHRSFSRIRELDISRMRVRDVSQVFPTEDFACLAVLSLNANAITSASPFAWLPSLRTLCLNDNRMASASFAIQDQGPSPSLPGVMVAPRPFACLEALELGGNAVQSVASLQLRALSQLKVLKLSNNEISAIEGLQGLSALEELFLDGNKIKTVDRGGLHGLRRLRILSLERNLVRTVPGLSGMQTLAKVNLSHNRIMETGEVERLVGLTALRDLDMAANPIARRATHRVHVLAVVPSLALLDGRPVEPEERDAADALVAQQEFFQQQQAQAQQGLPPGAKLPVRLQTMTIDGREMPAAVYVPGGDGSDPPLKRGP